MTQPKSESKKEEFRKYLESTGVLDAFTKVLVGLYEEPEKPGDALEFVKQHLHGGPPKSAEAETFEEGNSRTPAKKPGTGATGCSTPSSACQV
eukprot:Em0023g507a